MVELLIVIAVIGILTSVGVMSFQQYRARLMLNEAVQTVANTLREVGENAIAKSRGLTLTLGTSALTWSDATGEVGRITLPAGAKATLASGSTISYSGRGLPLQRYEIRVTRRDLARTVFLQPTGAVTQP